MAVYNRSRIVTAFFGVLWLSIAGLSILIMLGITGGKCLEYHFDDDIALRKFWQFAYHIHVAVPKALRILTQRFQSF